MTMRTTETISTRAPDHMAVDIPTRMHIGVRIRKGTFMGPSMYLIFHPPDTNKFLIIQNQACFCKE